MSDEVNAGEEPEETPADEPHAEWPEVPTDEPIKPVDPNFPGEGTEADDEAVPADDGE